MPPIKVWHFNVRASNQSRPTVKLNLCEQLHPQNANDFLAANKHYIAFYISTSCETFRKVFRLMQSNLRL
jgi:hypothetical protein